MVNCDSKGIWRSCGRGKMLMISQIPQEELRGWHLIKECFMEWKEMIMTYAKYILTFASRNWNSMSPLKQNRLCPFQDLIPGPSASKVGIFSIA